MAAKEISKRVDICVVSMGSGNGCDAQYLFASDILGAHRGHYPCHAKKYRDFYSERQRLHEDSILAFKEYKEEVESNAFPQKKNIVEIKTKEFDKFMTEIDKISG